MIQKGKQGGPFASASQQETSQIGKANTYKLLHSIRILFTARFKNKRKKIHSRQHRSKKRVNRANQTLTACFIPFAQQLPHDSRQKRRSIHISIAVRSESIRKMKYLQPAPFHSHNIYRTIQKQKEEDQFASASQQEASQSGKSNTYKLLHSIPVIFTA